MSAQTTGPAARRGEAPGGFVRLREPAVADLLGLPIQSLRSLLGSAATAEASRSGLEWDELARSVAPLVLGRLREALSAAHAVLGVSKRWVGGYPALVAQWDWSRNLDVLPDEVSHGSHRRLWWRCPRGPDHAWQAVAQSRTGGAGCPFCASRLVSVTNSLATKVPAVASQWHPERNHGLTPAGVVWSSNRKAWWRCPVAEDHEWEARINNRTSNDAGCPFCAGHRVSRTNRLSTVLPLLAAQWDRARNEGGPEEVTTGSNRLAWWQCPVNAEHRWRAAVGSRVRGSGCPSCAGSRLSRENCLALRRPEVAREWHPERNGALQPDAVAWSSNLLVWWRCVQSPAHEWQARINNRTTNGTGCPWCARRRAAAARSRNAGRAASTSRAPS